ncbi:MAG: hypothetical protein GYB65_15020 [Chloroflexi bacterium]|nr:hypothetical protein [Chloroflexota bacterium]
MPESRALSLDQLAALFGFAPEDVALNRQGCFSLRQRQDLLYRNLGVVVRSVSVLLLGIILAVTLRTRADPAEWWVLVLLVSFGGLLLIITGWRALFPTVQVAVGPVVRAGNSADPHVQVGEHEFRIARRRWQRLPPALPGSYWVHHTSHRLLSIEPQPVSDQPSRYVRAE